MECFDILQQVRQSGPVSAGEADERGYRRIRFRVADVWPDWTEAGVNMIRLEFGTKSPSLIVTIDDISVF
jgi:hypothetical protein